MKAVTNGLRTTLAERQISQTDLAELAGIPYATIRRIVRKDSNPRLDDALRISRVLKMSIEDLFYLAVA